MVDLIGGSKDGSRSSTIPYKVDTGMETVAQTNIEDDKTTTLSDTA